MTRKQRLASLDQLKARGTIKFDYRDKNNIRREGFLAWHQEQLLCYENTCRHIPITLDYGDGQFYTPDKSHFICQTHGATYEPLTGKCIAGPCVGAFLRKLPVEIRSGEILLAIDTERDA